MVNVISEWLAQSYAEVSPMDFYRFIFPEGSLQKQGEYRSEGSGYKYNGIVVSVTKEKKKDGRPLVKRYTVTDDLKAVEKVCQTDDFSLMSPISYVGKERTAENSRYLYAIAVDLDHIKIKGSTPIGLRTMIDNHIENVGRLPKPTFIVSSGTGAHLYYVLDKPIALYPETAQRLQLLKHDLTEMIWHETICDIKSKKDIQQEGIYQGFRVVGTITKRGDRARAFRLGDRVSMDYLNGFIRDESHRLTDFKSKGELTLDEAKEKYPEWYERRVVRGEKPRTRGAWHNNRALYEWWLRKIKEGATVGHRYHCLRILAIYAQKCSYYDAEKNPTPVTREELERDMWSLFDFMESLTDSNDNHFTSGDVLDALESFEDRWIVYPRKAIEYRSAISIPPNRRNGRTQGLHLKIARQTLDILNVDSGHALQGRKPKKETVRQWRESHPLGKKSECIKETGLSKHTVYKWWDAKETS